MQATDNGKQTVNTLIENYRPIAIRALLAAVLMQKAGKADPATRKNLGGIAE